MTLYLIQIGKWLLGKSAVIIIATLVAIGVYALYLYIADSYRVEKQRVAQLADFKKPLKPLMSNWKLCMEVSWK